MKTGGKKTKKTTKTILHMKRHNRIVLGLPGAGENKKKKNSVISG